MNLKVTKVSVTQTVTLRASGKLGLCNTTMKRAALPKDGPKDFIQKGNCLEDLIEALRKLAGKVAVGIESANRRPKRISLLVDNHDRWQLVDAELFGSYAVRVAQHGHLQSILLRERAQLFVGGEVLRLRIFRLSADPIDHHAAIAVFVGQFPDTSQLGLGKR